MPTTSFYPVLMTDDIPAATAFYRDILGFTTTFTSDWYTSLRLGSYELALLDPEHATVPHGYGTRAAGLLLNLETDDATALHTRLTRSHGIEPVLGLRDEDFGQRHFIIEGPGGVLIDIIEPIAPSPEFAAAYSPDALPRSGGSS
ncbi:VOC family protein [Nocardiopsis coralliicola]